MILRSYQEKAVIKALKTLESGQNPLVIMPTGSGKSLVIAELTKQLKSKQIIVVTPRIKLLQQNAKLIKGAGILSGKLGADTGAKHRIICGTYQTLIKKEFVEPDIIIIDEAHLVPEDDSEYARLLSRFPSAKIIGLTATPFRGYSKIHNHSNSRWRQCYEVGILELIKNQYLVPPRAFKTHSEIGRGGQDEESITRIILPTAISKLASLGCKRTLIFCRDIEHSEFVNNELKIQGMHSECIHSGLKLVDHDAIYHKFKDAKNTSFLVNCNMLTTGVDLPYVDSIILLRKISMGALYIQIIGRGLRIHEGKEFCAVLDYGKNIKRFGRLDDPSFLREKGDKIGSMGRTKEKHCEQCGLLLPIGVKVCCHCNYKFPIRTTLQIDSPNSQMLTIDLRQGTVKHITKKQESKTTWKITYLMDNGDNPFKFVNEQLVNTELSRLGSTAIYRISRNTPKIISFS
ncbi:MAG: DEAD/DEAH box helicase [Colwellia sp.]|jgi:DNA or RNA helicases of superfamily II